MKSNISTTTRSGARRAGDDYQDLIAIEAMTEYLEDPGKYSKIEFEVADVGCLDDIVRYSKDGQHKELYQVKYSLHPDEYEDAYSWDNLLFRKKDKNDKLLPSLIARWVKSFLQCHGTGLVSACLKTNRYFDREISALYDEQKNILLYHKIPENILKRLEEELNLPDVVIFFNSFKFYMGYREFDVLEESLRLRLKRLGCADDSYDSLCQNLHRWIRDGHISVDLQLIRTACNWHQLNSFDENFLIPHDYVVPDDNFYDEICGLLDTDTKCVLISAVPGAGKSSFISHLKQTWGNGFFIRHHYFLSLEKDTNNRFNHHDVLESLMHEMSSVCAEGVAPVCSQNSSYRDFRTWYQECAKFCVNNNKKLIVAIDGLDHVWRHMSSNNELDDLLRTLFPVPQGATVILGSQPLNGDREPITLYNYKANIVSKELPLFNRQAIVKWLTQNPVLSEVINPDDNVNGEYQSFIDLLLKLSSGHPLMLRYILQEALNALPSSISIYQLNDNISRFVTHIPKNITDYYALVKGRCTPCANFLLKCVSFSKWSWKHVDLISIAIDNHFSRDVAENSWNEVRHMFKSVRGEWQFIHESFLLYLQNEYSAEKITYIAILQRWLDSKGSAYLKWRFSAEFSAVTNNINKEWCIDALLRGYSIDDIAYLIARDSAIDLQAERYRDVASKSLWMEYFSNRYNFYDIPSIDGIWTEIQLLLTLDDQLPNLLLRNKSSISVRKLQVLFKYVREEKEEIDLFDELRDRFEISHKVRNAYNNQQEEMLEILFDIWGYSPWDIDTRVDLFNKNIVAARKSINALWYYNNKDVICQMLSYEQLQVGNKLLLSEALTILAKENGFDISTISGVIDNNYSCLTTGTKIFLSAPTSQIPQKTTYDDNNFKTRVWLSDALFFIAGQSRYNKEEVNDFIEKSSCPFWLKRIFENLSNVFTSDNNTFKDIIGNIAKTMADIKRSNDNRIDDYHFTQSLSTCWPDFLIKIKILLSKQKNDKQFTDIELRDIFSVEFCHPQNFLEQLLQCQRDHYLSEDACNYLSEIILGIPCDCSGEQGSRPAYVALMWARRNNATRAKEVFYRSIDLFYSYGWHKDGLFHFYIQAGKFFKKSDIKELFQNLIEASYTIGEYTDEGDFSKSMSKLLAEKWPQALISFYHFLVNNYAYLKAEHVFNEFCLAYKPSTELEKAVIRSNISVDFLRLISLKENNAKYRFILDDTQYIYKGRSPNNGRYNNGYQTSPAKKQEVNVESYPPDKLSEFIKNHDLIGEISPNRLSSWCGFWEKKTTPQDVLSALKKVAYEQNYATSELKRKIYEYENRINGNDNAWQYLIEYFVDIHGWSDHYSALSKAEEVWKIIKDKYPSRKLSFIHDTMTYQSPSKILTMWGCAGRLSQYLIFVGCYGYAMDIMRGTKDALERLMMPLGVNIHNLQVFEISDELLIDLLISRLEWPSSLVREKTCKELAFLLTTQYVNLVVEKLKCFIEYHDLDSLAQIGLFPFIIYKKEKGVLPKDLCINRKKPCSIALAYLLSLLFPQASSVSTIFETAPNDYRRSPAFDRMSKELLPPIYRSRAESLDRHFPNFLRQWGYEFEKLSCIDIPDGAGRDYYGDHQYEHLVVMDCLPSEKLRSAYLNALAWIASARTESYDTMEYLSLQTIPIDFGLWNLCYRSPLPLFVIADHELDNVIDTVSSVVTQRLQQEISGVRNNTQLIAFASGVVQTKFGVYELEARGFLQKTYDVVSYEEKDVFDTINFALTADSDTDVLDINDAEFFIRKNTNDEEQQPEIQGWEIIPLFARLDLTPIIRWQYWRAKRGIVTPSWDFEDNDCVIAKVHEDVIDFYHDGQKIGFYFDWNFGITEKILADTPPETGNAVYIEKNAIAHLLSKGYSYCITYKLTSYLSEDLPRSGSRPKEIYGCIGDSKIIVP